MPRIRLRIQPGLSSNPAGSPTIRAARSFFGAETTVTPGKPITASPSARSVREPWRHLHQPR